MATVKPVLYKTIFRIDYKAQLKFYELLYSSSQKLEGYPDWETTALSILLLNLDDHCSVGLNLKSISYEQDLGNNEICLKRVKDLIATMPEELQINSFTFFGFRQIYLIPVSMLYESLVTVINKKLYSQNEQIKKIFPQKLTDIMYRMDYSEDDYTIHLTLGPTFKEQSNDLIQINRKHFKQNEIEKKIKEIYDSYPKTSILVDLDFVKLKNNLKLEEIVKNVDYVKSNIESMITKLIGYILKT